MSIMGLCSIGHLSFCEKKASMGQQALDDTLKINFGRNVAQKTLAEGCAEVCAALVKDFQLPN